MDSWSGTREISVETSGLQIGPNLSASISPTFKNKVARELTVARKRAFETLDQPFTPQRRHRKKGFCAGCKCEFDQVTVGCKTCITRHAVRRRNIKCGKGVAVGHPLRR